LVFFSQFGNDVKAVLRTHYESVELEFHVNRLLFSFFSLLCFSDLLNFGSLIQLQPCNIKAVHFLLCLSTPYRLVGGNGKKLRLPLECLTVAISAF